MEQFKYLVAIVDKIIYTCDKIVYNTNDYKKNWGI